MKWIITAILFAYAGNLGWNGIRYDLPFLVVLGCAFAGAAVLAILGRPWSKWFILVVCFLFVVFSSMSIWTAYENTKASFSLQQVAISLIPGLLKTFVAVIVPVLAFHRVKQSNRQNA